MFGMTKDFVNELCRVSGGADCAQRLDQGLGLQPAVFEYFEGISNELDVF